jgi:hypothetical protein
MTNGGQIDMQGGSIVDGAVCIEYRSSDPTPVATGHINYNSADGNLKIYNGSSWVPC